MIRSKNGSNIKLKYTSSGYFNDVILQFNGQGNFQVKKVNGDREE